MKPLELTPSQPPTWPVDLKGEERLKTRIENRSAAAKGLFFASGRGILPALNFGHVQKRDRMRPGPVAG